MSVEFSKCSLMLMVTMGCNSRCRHCCLSASPERIGEHLSVDEMIGYIEDAYKVGIGSVGFTGGEPMLYYTEMHKPLALAYSLGMFIDIRTNASWAKDKATARKVFRYLKSMGLGRLGLSYDSYHAVYIDDRYIRNAIVIAQEMGIEFYLDWMGNEAWADVAEYLNVDASSLRFVGQPLRAGRAKRLGNGHFAKVPIDAIRRDNYNCSNGRPFTLVVFPEGYASLHQCCWVNPYLIRRVQEGDWITKLAEEMDTDAGVCFLKEYGVDGLISYAEAEYPQLLKTEYSQACEVCYDLLELVAKDSDRNKTITSIIGGIR